MAWLALVESNTTGSGRQFCAAARDLDLRPVVLTRDPGRYPYLAVDGIETRHVEATDIAAVASVVAQLDGPVAGVTSSSEYHIATASEIARRRGLPHPDPAAILACRDKAAQRSRLGNAGVPGARWTCVRTPGEAVAAARRIGLPVVVKPIAGSGSLATRMCLAWDEVAVAAVEALGAGPLGAALVEEYLPGVEYSVEAFDGEVVGICRKHLGAEPHFVEVGHDFPAPLDPTVRADLATTAKAALQALGLGWGPAHVELRDDGTGARIIEVNPRLAGGMIPRMVAAATGIDLVHDTVARVIGAALPRRARAAGAASIRFLVADGPGALTSIDGLPEARALPGVIEATPIRHPGDQIPFNHSFQDRLAYVIASATDPFASAATAESALQLLRPTISR